MHEFQPDNVLPVCVWRKSPAPSFPAGWQEATLFCKSNKSKRKDICSDGARSQKGAPERVIILDLWEKKGINWGVCSSFFLHPHQKSPQSPNFFWKGSSLAANQQWCFLFINLSHFFWLRWRSEAKKQSTRDLHVFRRQQTPKFDFERCRKHPCVKEIVEVKIF